MADKTYCIIFDPFGDQYDPKIIKNALRSDEHVSHWWNHLFNCFIVTSSYSSGKLTRRLEGLAPGVKFLVTETNLTNSQGLLPEQSWEWIREREREAESRQEQPAS